MRPKSIHTISLLASAIALALPSTSSGLGLGRLTVQSSLGQPLSAQIELTSASREELDSIAAKVADPSLYRQNNLTYQGVLSRARVSLERGSNGSAFLKVQTSTPVNEPYLDLMVELNWAAGRVVREYTFLLDPPGVAAPAPAVEPVTPRTAGAGSRSVTTAAAPAPMRIEGRDTPRETARAGSSPASAGGDTYTVRRGDSLARIANQLRPEGVSLEQMLVALFRANPNAFEGDNMNRLRSGSILSVPAREQIAGTPDGDASRVVRMQAADWRNYRDRVASGAAVADSSAGRESSGKITTAIAERTPAATPGRDQVRVSREAAGRAGGTGTSAALEDTIAQERALKDAQVRIAELEKTLRDLQRAVEMKSQTMAQLQAQAQGDAAKGGANPATAGRPAQPAGANAVAPVVPNAQPSSSTVAPASAAKAPDPIMRPPEPVTSAAPAKTPEIAKPAETAAAKTDSPSTRADASKPAATPGTPSPATQGAVAGTSAAAPSATSTTPTPAKTADASKGAAAKAPGKTETSLLSITEDVPGWALGAGALALVAGVGAIFAVRRRKTASFEDSIISGTDIKSNTVFGSTGGGIVNTGENSLSSDFSREGLSTIDTDEVDPIAEAEVYLAYGRDAQAEEILKDALKKDPQRQEVYLKLLEIHAQHNKPSSFEAVATELYAVSRGQGEVWQKAVALGRQLDPNNPLFSDGGPSAAATGMGVAGAAIGGAALGAVSESPKIKPEAPRAPDVPPVPVDVADLDHGMDFRLDDDISISPSQGPRRKPGEMDAPMHSADAPLAFDGGMPERARTPERAMAHPAADAAHAEAMRDLDFHLEDTEKPAPMRNAAHAEAAEPAATLARPQAAIDLDKLDLSFDPERSTFEDPTPSVLDGQWHDAATKLDLAKAYQEMGDMEGAREILQEVLHEGDDQQKHEAGALLAKLA